MAGDLRVAVLADVQNLYQSAKEAIGGNLSYQKLMQVAARKRTLVRAFAYLIDSEGVNQDGFVRTLEDLHFTIRRKPLITRADGSQKGDWDIGLAVDMIRIAERVDVICLATGDGDFVPAVEYVQQRWSCAVELFSFPRHTSRDLARVVDVHCALDKRFEHQR